METQVQTVVFVWNYFSMNTHLPVMNVYSMQDKTKKKIFQVFFKFLSPHVKKKNSSETKLFILFTFFLDPRKGMYPIPKRKSKYHSVLTIWTRTGTCDCTNKHVTACRRFKRQVSNLRSSGEYRYSNHQTKISYLFFAIHFASCL